MCFRIWVQRNHHGKLGPHWGSLVGDCWPLRLCTGVQWHQEDVKAMPSAVFASPLVFEKLLHGLYNLDRE